MPAPLIPHDVDLRDFPFMPLDVVRLRDSDLTAVASAEEFRCAVLLWCAAWHQTPAASLPDDDLILSQFAGFGRVVKEWRLHRVGALRGWVKCDDGRLYHPVIAEKANEAWEAKQKQRARTASATKARGRRAEPTVTVGDAQNVTMNVTEENAQRNDADPPTLRRENHNVTSPDGDRYDDRNVHQGTGTGTGTGTEDNPTDSALRSGAGGRSDRTAPVSDFERLWAECRDLVGTEPVKLAQDFNVLWQMTQDGSGVTATDVREGISVALRRMSGRIKYWKSFANWIRGAAQDRMARIPRGAPRPSSAIASEAEPRVDFGCGFSAPLSTIRQEFQHGRWPSDWGPRIGEPRCRVPTDLVPLIVGEAAA